MIDQTPPLTPSIHFKDDLDPWLQDQTIHHEIPLDLPGLTRQNQDKPASEQSEPKQSMPEESACEDPAPPKAFDVKPSKDIAPLTVNAFSRRVFRKGFPIGLSYQSINNIYDLLRQPRKTNTTVLKLLKVSGFHLILKEEGLLQDKDGSRWVPFFEMSHITNQNRIRALKHAGLVMKKIIEQIQAGRGDGIEKLYWSKRIMKKKIQTW